MENYLFVLKEAKDLGGKQLTFDIISVEFGALQYLTSPLSKQRYSNINRDALIEELVKTTGPNLLLFRITS